MSEVKMELEIDRQTGLAAAAAVMQALYLAIVVKRELSQKARHSINYSMHIPTIAYCHEL